MPRDLSPGGPAAPDADVPDAYSHAVSSAVARVAPVSAYVRVERALHARGREGAGSEFLITPGDHLVSTNHVASGAATIEVTLRDGRTTPRGSLGTIRTLISPC